MNLMLISCEIFFHELEFLLAQSPHRIDVEFLQKGLHDIPSAEMRSRIQERVDAASAQEYDAVLLGYGLCNNGLDGIAARGIPLVLPRAHDCITLFFGSRRRYREYFDANPGTYFKTTGWIERNKVSDELKQLSIPNQMGMDMTYAQLVEQYGEDNARFLWDELCNTEKHYRRIAFIEMGVEPDDRFEKIAAEEAASKKWEFEKVAGNLSLIRRLLNGEWDGEDFLIVPPRHRIRARHDEQIVATAARILVLGYGNPGRLDDGLGPALAERMQSLNLPDVEVEANYQLNVEDAELLSRFDIVVFADASVDAKEPFEFKPLEKTAPMVGFSSHSISAGSLLGLAGQLFGTAPRAYALAIRGYAFDAFGERLSDQALANLDAAAAFLERWIRSPAGWLESPPDRA